MAKSSFSVGSYLLFATHQEVPVTPSAFVQMLKEWHPAVVLVVQVMWVMHQHSPLAHHLSAD